MRACPTCAAPCRVTDRYCTICGTKLPARIPEGAWCVWCVAAGRWARLSSSGEYFEMAERAMELRQGGGIVYVAAPVDVEPWRARRIREEHRS